MAGNMWCFIDETWPTGKSGSQHVMCLGITLVDEERLLDLERHLFRVRVKYYGQNHACDWRRELKGNQLFSNATFKLHAQGGSSINHSVARELLSGYRDESGSPWVQFMGVVIYSDEQHYLGVADFRQLDFPMKRLLKKISAVAAKRNRQALLVFDQVGVQQDDLARSVYNYIAAEEVEKIHRIPLFGTSHTTPGIQISDLVAYILGRKAMKDDRMESWFRLACKLQWRGEVNGKSASGFERYDKMDDGEFTIRRTW